MLYADKSNSWDVQPSALTRVKPINGRNAHPLPPRSTKQGVRPVGAILLPPDPENTFHAVPSCQSLQLSLNPIHSSGASAAFARFQQQQQQQHQQQQQQQMEPPLPILRCPGLDRSVGNTPKCSAHSAGNTIGPPSPAGLVVVPNLSGQLVYRGNVRVTVQQAVLATPWSTSLQKCHVLNSNLLRIFPSGPHQWRC